MLPASCDDLSRGKILKQICKREESVAPRLLPVITMTMSPDNDKLLRKIQLLSFGGRRWVPVGSLVVE